MPMLAIQKGEGCPRLGNPPLPAVKHPDDVLIRVAMAGLCRTDVLAGFGRIPCAAGRILGHEFSGRVEAVGTGITDLRPGDRVTAVPLIACGSCPDCQLGSACPEPQFLGVDRHGAFAELIRVPRRAVHRLPVGLGFRHAAYTEPVAASLAIFEAPISPDQQGLLLGEGRIAGLAHELLKLRGFDAIDRAVTPPAGRRYDFIVECNLHQLSLPQVLAALVPGGLLVLKSRLSTQLTLPVQQLIRRRLRICGVHYGSFEQAIELLAQQHLDIERYLGPVYPLSDFIERFQAGEARKIFCSPNLDLCAE